MEIRLERLAGEIVRQQQNVLRMNGNKLERLEMSIKEHVHRLLDKEKSRLETAEMVMESRRPEKILSLGFAIVRNEGKAVTDSSTLSPGTMLDITLATGSTTAQVTKTNR